MQTLATIPFDQQQGRQQIYDISKWYNFMAAHELGIGEDQALQTLHDAAYANGCRFRVTVPHNERHGGQGGQFG